MNTQLAEDYAYEEIHSLPSQKKISKKAYLAKKRKRKQIIMQRRRKVSLSVAIILVVFSSLAFALIYFSMSGVAK